jgi:hypothetical protein
MNLIQEINILGQMPQIELKLMLTNLWVIYHLRIKLLFLLANPGTKDQMQVGKPISFNDPLKSNGYVNITGGTLNEFGNNAITGTTITEQHQ